eukprot:TRINITY_DN8378_c0_g1_i1.p1 TRINITY_DN8378_c0_g1~~TRINITY_DN8378_c0_g1_i1.p1  ORF type:complete len:516 (+),score=182.80 TRINITY_DN8378_c0_g1_i1:93-1640(+)
MSTLADAFLADLESSDEEGDGEERGAEQERGSDDSGQEEEGAAGEDDAAMEVEGVKRLAGPLTAEHFEDVESQLKVLKSGAFKRHMETIEQFIDGDVTGQGGSLEEEGREYEVLVAANKWVMKIVDEISLVHKFVRDHYSRRFPELEQLVPNAMDYVRVVRRIGNDMDMKGVQLQEVLPAASLMVVKLTASTTAGVPLTSEQLARVMTACACAVELDNAREKNLSYVASRMEFLAPNLSAIVGTSVAAKLIGAAGGLMALARMPASNVQMLGSSHKSLAGFSTASTVRHVGYIFECDIMRNTPPSVRKQAIRLISTKSTLAARADCYSGGRPAEGQERGAVGQKMATEIKKRIEKLQEPPPAKQLKALPAPDDQPRKKRGGKRMRKMKARYAQSEMRKMANRVAFGEAQAEAGNEGLELGMLGSSKNRVRVVVSEKRINKKLAQERSRLGTATAHTGGSGLATSLAFTPVQGFELENPDVAKKRVEDANKRYFSNTGTFTNLKAKTKKSEGEVIL